MSALQNTEIFSEVQNLAVIKTLPTDHTLEHEYGHLSPEELIHFNDDLDAKYKARVAQLQISAMYLISHTSSELQEWIHCYQVVSGQRINDSREDTYI